MRIGRRVSASSVAAGENSGWAWIFSITTSSWDTSCCCWCCCARERGCGGAAAHERACQGRVPALLAPAEPPLTCSAAASKKSEPACASTMRMSCSMGGKRLHRTRCKKSRTCLQGRGGSVCCVHPSKHARATPRHPLFAIQPPHQQLAVVHALDVGVLDRRATAPLHLPRRAPHPLPHPLPQRKAHAPLLAARQQQHATPWLHPQLAVKVLERLPPVVPRPRTARAALVCCCCCCCWW